MSNPCTFAYDATGRIQYAIQGDAPNAAWPTSLAIVTFDDSDTPTGAQLFRALDSYTIESGAAVLRPCWALSASTTSGVTSVTATLEHAPPTPPTSVTFTIAGTALSTAVTVSAPYTASVSFAVDAMVATQSIPLVCADTVGSKRGRIDLGTVGGQTGNIQVIAPSTSGNTSTSAYRVATTSKTVARAYYIGLSPEQQVEVLTQALQDLYGAAGAALHVLVDKVLPSLTASTYTPVTLTADEQNALTDMSANLISSLVVNLSTAYPSGGARSAQYASMVANAPTYAQGSNGYAQFLANTPGLE